MADSPNKKGNGIPGSKIETDFASFSSEGSSKEDNTSSELSKSSDDFLEEEEIERRKKAQEKRGRGNINTLTNLETLGLNALSPSPTGERRRSFFRGSIELKIEPVVSKAFQNIAKKAEEKQKKKENKEKKIKKTEKKNKGSLLAGINELSKQIINGYGVPVAIIHEGEMFGQFALVNDENRNAAIFTLEDCEFMVFHKKHFNFIKKYYSKEFNQRRNFIESVIPPIVDELTEQKKMHFIQNFTQTKFQRVISLFY